MSAIEQNKENAEDLIVRGQQLCRHGTTDQGLYAIARAVLLEPGNNAYRAVFVDRAFNYRIQTFDDVFKQALLLCLDDENLGHHHLFIPWYAIFRLDPEFAALQDIAAQEDFDIGAWAPLLNDPFLTKGLSKIISRNRDLEQILTSLRRAALTTLTPEDLEAITAFLSALSLQCFFNEYIFDVSEEEAKKLKKPPSDTSDDVMAALVLSCYGVLGEKEVFAHSDLPEKDKFLKLFFEDAEEDARIKDTLKSFGKIQDQVSCNVQSQYEENPYPRWQGCYIPGTDPKKGAGRHVLVAGCGTGQQAALTCGAYPAAQITAIDLSRNSLAYAKRKTKGLGMDNIEFLHGDILDLTDLDQKFDLIFCNGVLHHMREPQQGLRVLTTCLADDGIIDISLYSRIARRNIIKIQNWIEEQGFPGTAQGIRDFRRRLKTLNIVETFGEPIMLPADFCTTSECRDLLFHVQEHCFTCLEVGNMLKDIDLDLLSFAHNQPALRARYTELFPEDPQAVNLRNWHAIEEQNRDIFLNMYNFCVGKKGQHQPGLWPEWLTE